MIGDLDTVGDIDRIGRRAVGGLLGDGVCASAVYHASAASTNTLALHDVRSNADAICRLPRLYLADEQTAGRGRHGRTWHSNRGTLTFSLLIDWPVDGTRAAHLLSLGVGVGVSRSIEFAFAPLRARLKWPNDVYIDSGKVAGVLIETSHWNRHLAVIGVGVNVSHSPDFQGTDPASRRAYPARSISEVIGRETPRYGMLDSLVRRILESVGELGENEQEILDEFRSRCLLTGQRVTFRLGDAEVEGACVGVNDQGELAIQTPAGRHHLRSGEATLVRIHH